MSLFKGHRTKPCKFLYSWRFYAKTGCTLLKTILSSSKDYAKDLDKESSKLLSSERDNSCLCIPIGYNSVRTFVLANMPKTLIPLKEQYFTALFPQK